MSDDENDIEEDYVDQTVYDAAGNPVGTVADYDGAHDNLYLNPDPDLTEETERGIEWHRPEEDRDDVRYEIVDYDAWNESRHEDVDYDEWPFTIPGDDVEKVEDGLQIGDDRTGAGSARSADE